MKKYTLSKVTSWAKSPKTLAAKVGIGVAALIIVSVPVASALVVQQKSNENNKQAIVVESTENKVPSSPAKDESLVATKENSTTPSSSTTNNTEAPTSTSQAQTSVQDAAPTVVETTPAAPVYSDTYPSDLKDAPISSKFDQWALNNRQSVSYTAWKVNEAFGNMPKWGMSGNGNASNWPTLATSSNIATGTTPKLHSVGVVDNFTVWVESVNGDNVTVSFYNWGNTGQYGIWENIPASRFHTYIYFGG